MISSNAPMVFPILLDVFSNVFSMVLGGVSHGFPKLFGCFPWGSPTFFGVCSMFSAQSVVRAKPFWFQVMLLWFSPSAEMVFRIVLDALNVFPGFLWG